MKSGWMVQAEWCAGDHGQWAGHAGHDRGHPDWHAGMAQAQQQSLDHPAGCSACLSIGGSGARAKTWLALPYM